MQTEKIMFSLIRAEICDAPVSDELKNGLTKEICRELFRLSRKHDLSHIIASALSRVGISSDEAVSKAFDQELMLAIYRDTQRDYAISLTDSILEEAQIPHINLKGAVLRKLYPQSWMRTSCDIDILIRPSDVAAAEKQLCERGYIRAEDSSTHDYSFFSPNRIHVELHHTLAQDGVLCSADKMLNSVWEADATPENGRKSAYVMSPELFAVYHMAHMGRHLLHGGCGIRPFIDLWLVNRHLPTDTEKLTAILDECELLSLSNTATALGKVWLEDTDHTDATAALEEYILRGGVYGNTQNAAKVKAATGVGKIRSFLCLMFLPRTSLEVLYPKLKDRPALYPIYQVRRWFGYFDKNKRNKIKTITEQRNAVSTDEGKKTAELLTQLGLL